MVWFGGRAGSEIFGGVGGGVWWGLWGVCWFWDSDPEVGGVSSSFFRGGGWFCGRVWFLGIGPNDGVSWWFSPKTNKRRGFPKKRHGHFVQPTMFLLGCSAENVGVPFGFLLKPRSIAVHMAVGQNPVRPVNIPISTKVVVHLPQNGTIGFDPQPYEWSKDRFLLGDRDGHPPGQILVKGIFESILGVWTVCLIWRVPFWGWLEDQREATDLQSALF